MKADVVDTSFSYLLFRRLWKHFRPLSHKLSENRGGHAGIYKQTPTISCVTWRLHDEGWQHFYDDDDYGVKTFFTEFAQQITFIVYLVLTLSKCPAIFWFDLETEMDLCDPFVFHFKSIVNPCFQFLISIFQCHTPLKMLMWQSKNICFHYKNVRCWFGFPFSMIFWLKNNWAWNCIEKSDWKIGFSFFHKQEWWNRKISFLGVA